MGVVVEVIDHVRGVLGIGCRQFQVIVDRHRGTARICRVAVFPAAECVAVLCGVAGPGLAVAVLGAVGVREGHGLGLCTGAFGKAVSGGDPAAGRRKCQNIVVRHPVRVEEQIIYGRRRRSLVLRLGDHADADDLVRRYGDGAAGGRRPAVEAVAGLRPALHQTARRERVVIGIGADQGVRGRVVGAVGGVVDLVAVGRPLRGERDVVTVVAPVERRAVRNRTVERAGTLPRREAVAGESRGSPALTDRIRRVVGRCVGAGLGVDRVGMDAVVGRVVAVASTGTVRVVRHLVFVWRIP